MRDNSIELTEDSDCAQNLNGRNRIAIERHDVVNGANDRGNTSQGMQKPAVTKGKRCPLKMDDIRLPVLKDFHEDAHHDRVKERLARRSKKSWNVRCHSVGGGKVVKRLAPKAAEANLMAEFV
jgi:hypothetical protein